MVTTSCSVPAEAGPNERARVAITEASGIEGEWSIKAITGAGKEVMPPLAALFLRMSKNTLNVFEFNRKNFIIKSEFDDSVYTVLPYTLSDDGKSILLVDDEADTTHSFTLNWLSDDEMMGGKDFEFKFQRNIP